MLSRKSVIEQRTPDEDQTLQQIEEDIVVEGQIKNLTDYGAFVDLGGVDGLLHVTDMSWGRLQNPNELFKLAITFRSRSLSLIVNASASRWVTNNCCPIRGPVSKNGSRSAAA